MWEFENSMTMYSLTIFKINKWTERFDISKDLWQKYVRYIWKITIAIHQPYWRISRRAQPNFYAFLGKDQNSPKMCECQYRLYWDWTTWISSDLVSFYSKCGFKTISTQEELQACKWFDLKRSEFNIIPCHPWTTLTTLAPKRYATYTVHDWPVGSKVGFLHDGTIVSVFDAPRPPVWVTLDWYCKVCFCHRCVNVYSRDIKAGRFLFSFEHSQTCCFFLVLVLSRANQLLAVSLIQSVWTCEVLIFSPYSRHQSESFREISNFFRSNEKVHINTAAKCLMTRCLYISSLSGEQSSSSWVGVESLLFWATAPATGMGVGKSESWKDMQR